MRRSQVLTLKELKKMASNKGAPQATIEKDYAQRILSKTNETQIQRPPLPQT